jgi:predicted RNA-binding Zn-ribbon protein involved in translation (DUF1610 family)
VYTFDKPVDAANYPTGEKCPKCGNEKFLICFRKDGALFVFRCANAECGWEGEGACPERAIAAFGFDIIRLHLKELQRRKEYWEKQIEANEGKEIV